MVAIYVPSSPTFDGLAGLNRRSLFLHHINKELAALRSTPFIEREHIICLKVAALMTAGHLVAPFAQVVELYSKCSNIQGLINRLCGDDKLHLCNGSTDRYSFIESRKELYGSHKTKYPMYFKRDRTTFEFKHSPVVNTTSFIKSTISAAANLDGQPLNIISASEVIRLRDNANYIRNDFLSNPLAATFTVYESSIIGPKPSETRFFGNISARLFVNHYSMQHNLIVPTGYYRETMLEDYDRYPLFDLDLARRLLDKLGIGRAVLDAEVHQPFLSLISDPLFPEFCRVRIVFMSALMESVGGSTGESYSRVYQLIEMLDSIDFGSFHSTSPQSAGLLIARLTTIMRRLAEHNLAFQKAMRTVADLAGESRSVVILTATDLEDENLRASAIVNGYMGVDLKTYDGFTAAVYTSATQGSFLHVRTSAGSSGTHGSGRVSTLIADQLRPAYLMAVGIAFGLDEATQKLGDVMVAEYILSYEKVKVQDDKWQWRGDKIPANGDAISFGRQYGIFGEDYRVYVGGVFSGDKLVDDADFRAKLIELDPKSIGGEMEMAGVAETCANKGIAFTMVKGICDYGIGKNDSAQAVAATNAFKVAFRLLGNLRNTALLRV